MIESINPSESGGSSAQSLIAQSQIAQLLDGPITRSQLSRVWVIADGAGGERPERRCVWVIIPKPVCVLRIPIDDSGFGTTGSIFRVRGSGPSGTEVPLRNLPSRTPRVFSGALEHTRTQGTGSEEWKDRRPESEPCATSFSSSEPRITSPMAGTERWRMNEMRPEGKHELIRWRVQRLRCWLQAMHAHVENLVAAVLEGAILRGSGLVTCHTRPAAGRKRQ